MFLGSSFPQSDSRRDARPGDFLRQGPNAPAAPAALLNRHLMHNLQTERFFKPAMINNMMAIGTGDQNLALRASRITALYARRAAA